MSRIAWAWLWGMLAVVFCGMATPVAAREYRLENLLCVGGAVSASEAFDLPAHDLDCSTSRFANRSPFLRTHADVAAVIPTGEGELWWQTDPSSFDSMLLRFSYANGEQRLVDIDPQMAARNWFARTRFSVPIPRVDAALVSIDAVIERPRTYATARDVRLIAAGEAAEQHYAASLVYALICGLLIAPLVFDLFFLRMLRSRFILWHAGMTLGLLGFVYFNSGLVFAFFPDLPLEVRYQFNTLSLTLAIACAVMFALDIVEDGFIAARLRKLLLGLVAFMLGVRFAMMLDLEVWRMNSHNLYLFSILPVSAALIAAIVCAFKRGSRVAIYLVAAFLPILIAALIRLLIELSAVSAAFPIDDLLFLTMVLLVLATSAAVGDRFMVLRVERDRARINALKMQRMAHSDALTGVANRRAFDAIERIERGQALIMADIDHFKAINDTQGHAVGDAVLADTASRLKRAFSSDRTAQIYRLGGEEFAVIFECRDSQVLRDKAEAARREVERVLRRREDDLPSVTISIGGALGRGRPLVSVYKDADSTLYRAKQAGRNRVVISA